uniref:Uncharacterized protein n=1 Tax=Magnetococcus massalia (strain MO-1) TaxID=451514 RepID=A0A1S7LMK3_MAGMO|nr:conserved membrane protein of unknown function [Candidatus Magnetococcus massalia]
MNECVRRPMDPTFFAVITHLLLWTLFGVVHSTMASHWFKLRWCRLLGPLASGERLFYNLFAALTALAILLHGRAYLPQELLWPYAPWVEQLLLAGRLLGVVLLLIALSSYDLSRFAGFKQIRYALRGEALPDEPLRIGLLHRWVRHPIYTAALLYLWSQPLSLGELVTHLSLTLYLLIGMGLEERRLQALYGERYGVFCRAIPALIPKRLKPLPHGEVEALLGR